MPQQPIAVIGTSRRSPVPPGDPDAAPRGFDPGFFGIPAAEAAGVDLQQRTLLELVWQACEHAGLAPDTLRGTDTALFVAAPREPAERVSALFDLRGPGTGRDTAPMCSLAAVDLACRALLRRAAPLALAGGVTPGGTAGILVLKRLADARRDGDRVLALIRGTDTLDEGDTGASIESRALAREHGVRAVYARAGITAGSVDVIAAHGVGHPDGDRAEIAVLARVFGRGRPADAPCVVAAVTPRPGPTAATGVESLISVVLALRHETLPPTPGIGARDLLGPEVRGLGTIARPTPWRRGPRPRRAAVSCFGPGAALAHAVLEEAPATRRPGPVRPARADTPADRPRLFPVSARSEAGVRAEAHRLAEWLDARPHTDLDSVGHTLALRRPHLSHRVTVPARTLAELAAALRHAHLPGVVAPDRLAAPRGPVWLFPGRGTPWTDMGGALMTEEPAFLAGLDSFAEVYAREYGMTPRQAVAAGDWTDPARVEAMTPPFQVALADVWAAHGIRPAAVLGRYAGRISAAVITGTLTREEAGRLACRRAGFLAGARGTRARPAAPPALRLPRPPRVPFRAAVTAAAVAGHRLFTEISPHPVLADLLARTLAEAGADHPLITHSLRRGRPEQGTLLANLALLHSHGSSLDWSCQHPAGELLDLPPRTWRQAPDRCPSPPSTAPSTVKKASRHDDHPA
ncbi:acyltransferase domain-containing protein (plasmid) [Streptomyces sp. BI20]|uniref:acyltransferase domain-containing protein n=1 Tax=Streptomyces sp. BI20 TaxID=3403460 RepID=UPI003C714372